MKQSKNKNVGHKEANEELRLGSNFRMTKQYETHIGFVRGNTSEARKRTTMNTMRHKIFHHNHDIKRDDNDVPVSYTHLDVYKRQAS